MLTLKRLSANRSWRLSLRSIASRVSLACVVCVLICSATSAQIKFVQITDPHLYDDPPEATENKRAFTTFVAKIDKLISSAADYRFVVVTGDIGIEKLVKPFLDRKNASKSQQERDDIDRAITLKLTSAAWELANIIGQSRVKVWLFLPGNNDLIAEDPNTINYYRDFVMKLRDALPDKEVVDLCPTDDAASGVYSPDKSFVFIGFNNASFKNDDKAMAISDGKNIANITATNDPANQDRLSTTTRTNDQLKYVQQVLDRVNGAGTRPAYIFYHIPEIDDPHPVLNSDLKLLEDRALTPSDHYAVSSWFVDGRVRRLWWQVVMKPNVKGLFAGHFHDWRQDTYKSSHWLVTPDYSLSKLYICPPVAIKRQGDQGAQARGFQAVSIDARGKVAVNVFWYDGITGMFEDEKAVPGKISESSLLTPLRYVWGSIPSYLPFYLLLIVCLYAAYKGLKSVTIVAPFQIPAGNQLPFGEYTVANTVQDALVIIHTKGKREMELLAGKVAQITSSQSAKSKPETVELKLPEIIPYEVPNRYAVEVKGFSHESLISLSRKVLHREKIISGDVVHDGDGFSLIARCSGVGYWACGPFPATTEGLKEGSHKLALKIVESTDPISLAAYEIAEKQFEAAYKRLRDL